MKISQPFKHLLLALLFVPALALGLRAQEGDNAPVPGFVFTDIQGETITPENLKANRPVIFFYFDPDCDHCQQQATWVNESLDKFNGVNLVWVSWGEMDMIREFKEKYFPGVESETLFFTKDENYAIDDYFGYSVVPSIYVYDMKWERKVSFKTETQAPLLLKYAYGL